MKRYWIGLAIWGAGLVFVWWLSKGDWRVVSAIATWLLAGGVGFAILQVRQARKSTNAQLAMELFEGLRNPEFKRIIHDTIFKNEPEAIKGFLDDDKKDEITREIDHMMDWFHFLGTLVIEGIVDRKLAIGGFGGVTALKCWYQLAPYIRQQQKTRGSYCENYETFARLCLDYFHKEDIHVRFYRNGEEDKDLVTELTELVKSQKNEATEKKLYPRTLKEIKKDRENKARAEKIKKKDKGKA